jgi:predicted permease
MDGYLPLGMLSLDPASQEDLTKRDHHSLHALARLKPGVSLQQALASLRVVAQQLSAEYPETNKGTRVYLYPETLARPEPESSRHNPLVAAIFLALVTLVLLLACVNVANILLVRATTRRKELAIRSAMGAGRTRIIRQLLTESVMLALLGGAAGALIGMWASSLLGSIRLPGDLPFRFDFSMDWRVFSYVAAIALLTGIVVGLIPALRASRVDLNDALREGGRSLSGGAGRHRLRNALVASQVAGSLILLVAASLFVRSLANAEGVNLGFRADHVMNFAMDPAQLGYDEARGKEFYRQILERVGAMPAVQSASFAFSVPLGYSNDGDFVVAEGQVLEKGDKGPYAGLNAVTPGYFSTMGVSILRGRGLTAADTETSQPVAVVNETFANKLWPGQDPLGKRFSHHGAKGPYLQVIGVTSNGKYGFIFEDPLPFFYVPLTQEYRSLRVLQVRTALPPKTLALPVEKEIHALEPELPVFDVISMEESLGSGNGFFLLRMGAMFAGALGALGLVLAVVGVYGVVSYSANQRTNEIGIRMALGAQRTDILKMVVAEGLRLVLLGLGIGIAAALGLTRFLANLLFGIKPYDPITYCGAAILLVVVAFIACYIPARRSTRIDPMAALRYE